MITLAFLQTGELLFVLCVVTFIVLAILKPTLRQRSGRLLVAARVIQFIALAIVIGFLLWAAFSRVSQ